MAFDGAPRTGVKTWDGTPAERAFISIPGKVACVEGRAEAERPPYIKQLFFRAAAGGRVVFPSNNSRSAATSSARRLQGRGVAAAESRRGPSGSASLPTDPETEAFLGPTRVRRSRLRAFVPEGAAARELAAMPEFLAGARLESRTRSPLPLCRQRRRPRLERPRLRGFSRHARPQAGRWRSEAAPEGLVSPRIRGSRGPLLAGSRPRRASGRALRSRFRGEGQSGRDAFRARAVLPGIFISARAMGSGLTIAFARWHCRLPCSLRRPATYSAGGLRRASPPLKARLYYDPLTGYGFSKNPARDWFSPWAYLELLRLE